MNDRAAHSISVPANQSLDVLDITRFIGRLVGGSLDGDEGAECDEDEYHSDENERGVVGRAFGSGFYASPLGLVDDGYGRTLPDSISLHPWERLVSAAHPPARQRAARTTTFVQPFHRPTHTTGSIRRACR